MLPLETKLSGVKLLHKSDLKATIPSNNYDKPKTTEECGMF
jgi:hypothetical protein